MLEFSRAVQQNLHQWYSFRLTCSANSAAAAAADAEDVMRRRASTRYHAESLTAKAQLHAAHIGNAHRRPVGLELKRKPRQGTPQLGTLLLPHGTGQCCCRAIRHRVGRA